MKSKEKYIFDIVHGYISIGNNTENIEKIINKISFQRLRKIKQLTAQHLFPSANHTRFEHSLGVMHLSGKFFEKINQDLKNLYINKYSKDYNEIILKGESDRTNTEQILIYEAEKTAYNRSHNLYMHLRFASLLHDIGHTPNSHLGESFFICREIFNVLVDVSINKIDLNREHLIKLFEYEESLKPIPKDSLPWENQYDAKVNCQKHELMSCVVLLNDFFEELQKIHKFDYEFLFRIICGIEYDNEDFWDKNIIIRIVNSSVIDADKLDYLLRDNYMVGHVAQKIDIDRFLNSLYIDLRTLEIAYKSSGLSAIQKIINCKDELYLWVYNHHTVAYTDFLQEVLIEHLYRVSEKNKTNNEYKTNYDIDFDLNRFFSPLSITEKYLSDEELYGYLLNFIQPENKKKCTEFTQKILNQLFHRQFLKPYWKTPYEYKKFLEDEIVDDEVIDRIEKDIISLNARRSIIKELIKEVNSLLQPSEKKLSNGDVFLVKRSNKFYYLKKEFKIYVTLSNSEDKKMLKKQLPQKDFALFGDVTFYLLLSQDSFDKLEYKQLVKKCFVNILKNKTYSY